MLFLGCCLFMAFGHQQEKQHALCKKFLTKPLLESRNNVPLARRQK